VAASVITSSKVTGRTAMGDPVDQSLMVSVNVVVKTQAAAVRVAELLSRTAVGLGLEGFYASMSITSTEEESE
jgi:hypothetical protein